MDPDQEQVFDDKAWGVVLEYLDLQMMDPSRTGAPKPVRDGLEHLFAFYSSYKRHLEALMPKEGQHYAYVPGMDVATTTNSLY